MHATNVCRRLGGTPMTTLVAAVPDPEADIRWREWKARGAEDDRRRTIMMRRLAVLIGIGLAVLLFVQLV